MTAAAASVVPVPGLDWAVDAALLSRLLPRINAEFGLTPEQIDRLDPSQREQVHKAVALVGSALIGKLITRDMVLRLTSAVGMRLTTKQPPSTPLAGQALSATLATPRCATWASSTSATACRWHRRRICNCQRQMLQNK